MRAKRRRIAHVAPNVENRERGQNAGEKQDAPCQVLRHRQRDDLKHDVRGKPADGPRTLHEAEIAPARLVLRPFRNEHGADGPLTAETQAFQRAEYGELRIRLREAA